MEVKLRPNSTSMLSLVYPKN